MSSTAREMIDIHTREEFKQVYSDNDILTRYCEENSLESSPEVAENLEDDIEEFKEMMYSEYKEQRLEEWH